MEQRYLQWRMLIHLWRSWYWRGVMWFWGRRINFLGGLPAICAWRSFKSTIWIITTMPWYGIWPTTMQKSYEQGKESVIVLIFMICDVMYDVWCVMYDVWCAICDVIWYIYYISVVGIIYLWCSNLYNSKVKAKGWNK